MTRKYVKQWFVLCLGEDNPNAIIGRLIGAKNIEVWVPVFDCMMLQDGVWKRVVEPAFCDYILLHSELGWAYIEETINAKLIRSGDRKPRPLTDEELKRCINVEFVQRWVVGAAVSRGEKVVVESQVASPYAGLSGDLLGVVDCKHGFHALVKLDLSSLSSIVVSVPYDHLRPACLTQ